MRRILCVAGLLLLVPGASAAAQSGRPVAIVAAETSNQVIAVSLGPHGGHVLRRVQLVDPLMVASSLHGPAVVLSRAYRLDTPAARAFLSSFAQYGVVLP